MISKKMTAAQRRSASISLRQFGRLVRDGCPRHCGGEAQVCARLHTVTLGPIHESRSLERFWVRGPLMLVKNWRNAFPNQGEIAKKHGTVPECDAAACKDLRLRSRCSTEQHEQEWRVEMGSSLHRRLRLAIASAKPSARDRRGRMVAAGLCSVDPKRVCRLHRGRSVRWNRGGHHRNDK
jgi:hypothetical protein